jgi:hypothetical protein
MLTETAIQLWAVDNTKVLSEGCGHCARGLALYTSLPKVLNIVTSGDTERSCNQGMYWECLNCGARYVTVTSVLNLLVREKPTSEMQNLSSLVCTTSDNSTREMLQGIYFTGLILEKASNGTTRNSEEDSREV